MKVLICVLFAFVLICSAQETSSSSSSYPRSSSAADSQIRCPEIEYHGMQTTKYIPTRPYIINWDQNTIDLNGIVDSVGLDTFFVDQSYKLHLIDSSRVAAKILKIKQVELGSAENTMRDVFDSNFVYAPLNLNVMKDDTISIQGYSASIFLDCSSRYTVPYGFFMGTFSVNPTSEITGFRSAIRKLHKTAEPKHNRDASGKFLTKKNRIVKY